jgi:hypothetical protein
MALWNDGEVLRCSLTLSLDVPLSKATLRRCRPGIEAIEEEEANGADFNYQS